MDIDDKDGRIASLEIEVERLHNTVDVLFEELSKAFSYIEGIEYELQEKQRYMDGTIGVIERKLYKHTQSFHAMLISKGDAKDESNIP